MVSLFVTEIWVIVFTRTVIWAGLNAVFSVVRFTQASGAKSNPPPCGLLAARLYAIPLAMPAPRHNAATAITKRPWGLRNPSATPSSGNPLRTCKKPQHPRRQIPCEDRDCEEARDESGPDGRIRESRDDEWQVQDEEVGVRDPRRQIRPRPRPPEMQSREDDRRNQERTGDDEGGRTESKCDKEGKEQRGEPDDEHDGVEVPPPPRLFGGAGLIPFHRPAPGGRSQPNLLLRFGRPSPSELTAWVFSVGKRFAAESSKGWRACNSIRGGRGSQACPAPEPSTRGRGCRRTSPRRGRVPHGLTPPRRNEIGRFPPARPGPRNRRPDHEDRRRCVLGERGRPGDRPLRATVRQVPPVSPQAHESL